MVSLLLLTKLKGTEFERGRVGRSSTVVILVVCKL